MPLKYVPISIVCWLALALSSSALSASFEGRVVKVSDGDTITVLRGTEQVRVRLAGIDAPEKDQPFGRKSREQLASIVSGQIVVIEYTKTDRYGRIIGKVLFGGRDVNLEQVRKGVAHWYKYYKDDQSPAEQEAYSQAERSAKTAAIGLWSQSNPTNPYDWRKRKRNDRPSVAENSEFECNEKQYCRQMSSCEEAKFYLNKCGLTRLDGDDDGVPCEAVCND